MDLLNPIPNPEAEYWLDWFHVTMRITVMKQMAKGLTNERKAAAETGGQQAEAPAQKSIEKELRSLKWNLWHGNVERALERIEDLQEKQCLRYGVVGSRNRIRNVQRRYVTPVCCLTGSMRREQMASIGRLPSTHSETVRRNVGRRVIAPAWARHASRRTSSVIVVAEVLCRFTPPVAMVQPT